MNNNVKIKIQNLSFSYHDRSVLKNITMEILENSITAVTGPSGQGKSTLLMIFNRLWENVEATKMKGDIKINFGNGFQNIYDSSLPVHELRRQVGMVFQVPNPLPMSIYNNVGFPLKLKGETNKEYIFPKIKKALKNAFLWEEVKDRLNKDARDLSGGQQQRLCIARALILNPQVLLLDEPTSSLDDKSGRVIENLLLKLKKTCTIVLVSHYQDQVKRIADTELLLSDGKLL